MKPLFVEGLPDVNGAHALIRFAMLVAVLAIGAWKLKGMRDDT